MESPDLIALRRMLGRAIKQARVQAQLSQAEVARRMNVPQSWVSNVETAVRRIDVVEAWMLADILEIDLTDLKSFVMNGEDKNIDS